MRVCRPFLFAAIYQSFTVCRGHEHGLFVSFCAVVET